MKSSIMITSKTLKGIAVEQLLLYAGLVMVLTLPYFTTTKLVPVDQYLATTIIIILSVLAGFYSRFKPVVVGFNILVSIIATFIFELVAIRSFQAHQIDFFLVNILLTGLFYTALYANSKAIHTYILVERKYLSQSQLQ